MDVITSHLNADFDALASAIAAKKLYPDAVIVMPGSLEKKVREFIDLFRPVELRKFREIAAGDVRRLIIVDTKHPLRIGPLKELLANPGIKVHIYDHHPPGPDDIKGEIEIIEHVGAVSTLFTEILQKKSIPLSPMEATVLCLGIYEETGSLVFTSTTPRDLTAAAYLLKRGANLKIVADFIKGEMSREEVALLNELAGSLREVVIQGIKVKIGKGTMEGFSDVAHLAHQIMDMEDMDGVFLLIGIADKVVIVARSKAPELDVSQVLSGFGGGGHPSAASATIKDMPLELVEDRLVASLSRTIRPMKLAMDVMTAPVIVIQWNSRIREAEAMMTRYGVNVLPVVRQDRYMGILAREVVEKALFHGFGRSDCIDFATTDAITAAQDTPVTEVEGLMIEQNQRFIPVLDGDRIVGAITRTDILRSLYEDFLRKNRVGAGETPKSGAGPAFSRDISKTLKDNLPERVFSCLRTAGETADDLGMGAYLVGGFVRDLLKREQNLDIDIVIEGSGIDFARAFGTRINAKVTTHERFGTAQVIISGNGGGGGRDMKIDVATARTEYYESPATLPKVEVSSIKKDLYRRDFTINTLAVRLNRKDFGRLIDFFGAQRDLKEKVVRVLHNLSFVEDPTRAFRAIRFSERFGFKLTKHTENLIRIAVRMNIFEKLSGTRIYDELVLFFRETHPIRALKRLGEYDLLKVIHPRVSFSAEVESALQSVHDTCAWFDLLFLDELYDKSMLYIMALLHQLDREELGTALTRLAVPDPLRKRISKGFERCLYILKMMRPDDPVAVYHLLKGEMTETLLYSMALCRNNEKKKGLSQFLLEWRYVTPVLKGKDLRELGVAPGPVYSEVLTEILDEKLEGRLSTREEEIAFAKRFIGGKAIRKVEPD